MIGLLGECLHAKTGRLQPHHAGGRASVEVILTDWPSASMRGTADGGGGDPRAEIILPILWRIRMGSLFIANKQCHYSKDYNNFSTVKLNIKIEYWGQISKTTSPLRLKTNG